MLVTGGFEKTLRIYDLNRPDAAPREVDKSPGSVRIVTWLHSDQTILSSCTDMGGVRFVYTNCRFDSTNSMKFLLHECHVEVDYIDREKTCCTFTNRALT
jgi:WD40 repeat protein